MEIELGRLIRALRRFWWLPVVGALVLGLVSGLVPRFTSPTYTATTRVLIVPAEFSGTTIMGGSANMLIDTATSRPVLNTVIHNLGLNMTAVELERDVFVVTQEGTQIILVSVTSHNPQMATDISIAIAETLELRATDMTLIELQNKEADLEFQVNTFDDQIALADAQIAILLDSENPEDAQVQAELASLQRDRLEIAQARADVNASLRSVRAQSASATSGVSIVEPAEVPETRDGLPAAILAIIGGFVGAVIGAALILVAAVRDHTIVNGEQVTRITGAPVLRNMSHANMEQDVRMINRLVGGLRSSDSPPEAHMSIAAPTHLEPVDLFWNEAEVADDANFVLANGVASDEGALAVALGSTGVVITTQLGKTTESDLRTTIETLRIARVPVLGNIVVSEK